MQSSEQIKEAPAEGADQKATASEAAERLACAFATLAEFADFIPTNVYNQIADALNEFCDDVEWQSDPRLMRLVLPHIFRAVIEKREQFEGEIEV